MTEAIHGHGEIRRQGKVLCRVRYQLQRHEGPEETRFTLTDGIIEIEQTAVSADASAADVIDLPPGKELTLILQEPLRDGRETLTVVVEPYEGHRPDERYQVTIKEGSDWQD